MQGTSKLWLALLTVVVWGFAATAAHAQSTIKAADAAWQPAEVTVPTGTTVRWEFDQTSVPHTVTSTSTNWTKNESREPGGPAVTETFDEPGTLGLKYAQGAFGHPGRRLDRVIRSGQGARLQIPVPALGASGAAGGEVRLQAFAFGGFKPAVEVIE